MAARRSLNVGHYYRQVYWAPAYFTGTGVVVSRFDADLGADESTRRSSRSSEGAPRCSSWQTRRSTTALVHEHHEADAGGGVRRLHEHRVHQGFVGQRPSCSFHRRRRTWSRAIVGKRARRTSSRIRTSSRRRRTPGSRCARATSPTRGRSGRTPRRRPPSRSAGIPKRLRPVLNDVDNNDQWDTMHVAFVLRGKIVDPRVPYVVPGCSGTGLSLDDGGIDFAINQSSARVGDVVLVAFDVMSESVGTLTPTLPGSDGTLVLISTSRASRRTRYLFRFTAARPREPHGQRCWFGWAHGARTRGSPWPTQIAHRSDRRARSTSTRQHGSDIDDPGVWSADVSGSASLATDLMVVVASLTPSRRRASGSVVPYRPSKSQRTPTSRRCSSRTTSTPYPTAVRCPPLAPFAAGAFVWPHPRPWLVIRVGRGAHDVERRGALDGYRRRGGGGGTPPTISAPSPSTTTSLTRFQPVTIDVADDVGLALVVVYASYAGQPHIWEIVHDNHSFGPSFTGGANQKLSVGTGTSSCSPRRRVAGVPRIRVVAVNTSGQVASYDP